MNQPAFVEKLSEFHPWQAIVGEADPAIGISWALVVAEGLAARGRTAEFRSIWRDLAAMVGRRVEGRSERAALLCVAMAVRGWHARSRAMFSALIATKGPVDSREGCIVDVVLELAAIASRAGSPRKAFAWLRRGLAALATDAARARLLEARLNNVVRRGDRSETLAVARLGLGLGKRNIDAKRVVMFAGHGGNAALSLGDFATAQRMFARCAVAAGVAGSNDTEALHDAHVGLAEVALARRDTRSAARLLDQLRAMPVGVDARLPPLIERLRRATRGTW